MDRIPSVWRTETLHALSVHFPVALLTMAAVTGFFYFVFIKKKFAHNLRFTTSFLLWIGTLAFWISFYTGREAYSVVVRTICDPFILKDHLYWSYVAGYFFSAGVVFDILFHLIKHKSRKIFDFVTICLLIGGAVVLSYVGHLGASVVYQQAGGVYVPTEDCSEYN